MKRYNGIISFWQFTKQLFWIKIPFLNDYVNNSFYGIQKTQMFPLFHIFRNLRCTDCDQHCVKRLLQTLFLQHASSHVPHSLTLWRFPVTVSSVNGGKSALPINYLLPSIWLLILLHYMLIFVPVNLPFNSRNLLSWYFLPIMVHKVGKVVST